MAARTVETGIDVDAALDFLGRQENPQISGEVYFQTKMKEVINIALTAADEKRFSLVTQLMDGKDKGKSISQLRELLGV